MNAANLQVGLSRERANSARRLNAVRLAAVASFFGLFAILGGVLHQPAWQGNLGAFSVYLLLALAVFVGARRSVVLEQASFFAVALLDAPMVMVLQLATYPSTPDPASVAGYSIGLFVALLVLASLSLERRTIFATAAVGAVCELFLQHEAHVSGGAMLATPLVLGVAGFGADYGRGRVCGLLADVHDREHLAAERARELAAALRERDAAEAAKLRLEKLATIGQFSATIGHDLRNPLAVIRTACFVVFRRIRRVELGSDEIMRDSMQMAERELDRCEQIITDLLDFARERELDRKPTPLAPLVDEALSVVRKRDGVDLVNRVPADLPPLQLDPGPFRQVLVNLVQNGADAMPSGRPGRVEIGAELAGERARIWIRDDGSGISAEHLPRLFEPLFTTKRQGTGLGLAIVANLVRQHRGEIHVDSTPGQGTTFELQLPLGERA